MADPSSFGNPERDTEQAIIALKKGTQLIKYSRKGKPKFCPFRLSTDETTLVWYSHGDERNLKLATVTKIIPGQRTAVFKRYLRPEKDYLSFSLLYKNGDRSLDLICKDKAEADIWFAGLKALISPGGIRSRRTKSDFFDDGTDFGQDIGRLSASIDYSPSIAHNRVSIDWNLASSDAGSVRSNMQLRSNAGDGFRISVSSTPSCSSGASGPDDIESLGDVYMWGEVWSDAILPDGSVSSIPIKTDVLTPKPLESNVVLDVHQIACGVRHVALVTRQGEVFTWGEESGGRLGHGIDKDFSRPSLVEFLAVNNVDFVACGEYHTCAVSTSGDLFTWGDGTHNAGLLGQGNEVSHWIPKRVAGPLEGLQVLSVSCGSWHSALSTTSGKLFTFGDGTFGVLGHGDRESVPYPKEVQSLSGLKAIKVSCGVWHTAAIVDIMDKPGPNISSRKLFTWGDGDKYRLGHGNKDTYLVPTIVSSLVDYNFQQLACGHTMTVALTTSGHVFTMGGTAYGQLGNPNSDGKIPCLVQDRLVGEFVEEISCGAYHVAVLTSRSEVFTWGRGSNGRLGHGDTEDRKTPTLVEALRDRHVKNVSCGSNFTSSICIHKWVSGADQSVCSGCRQAFGFTRKRHNCYNCGLVHCHACSSKKALKAALAPTPGKPHRVCDACHAKLKSAEAGNSIARRSITPHHSVDSRDYSSRGEVRSSRIFLSGTMDSVKYLEIRTGRPGNRCDSSSMVRASQVPSLLPLRDIAFPSSLSAIQNALKPIPPPPPPHPQLQPQPQPLVNSRSSSPYSRRPSPPRSTTPVFSRGVIDGLKKTNDVLNQEVAKLQHQVRSLKQKCDAQDQEIEKLTKEAKQAASLAAEQFTKWTAAKELVTSFTEQLKEMEEKVPQDVSETEIFKSLHARSEEFLKTSAAVSKIYAALPINLEQRNEEPSSARVSDLSRDMDHGSTQVSELSRDRVESSRPSTSNTKDNEPQSSSENGFKSHESSTRIYEGGKEVVEQFEPGVYIILLQLRDGTRVFKRVKFSKRRFNEQQAADWYNANRDRLLRRYGQNRTNTASAEPSNGRGVPAEAPAAEENCEPTTPVSET